MNDPSLPRLDLSAILATRAFDQEDLEHNRRGVLSPKQDAWRVEHPTFFDEGDVRRDAVESLFGRVVIEGRYTAGRMGQTTFAKLAQPGRRLSLRPGIERSLVRDAPYRAYAACGWLWSIEPISEEELRASTSGAVTYRSPDDPAGTAAIARALEDALSIELSFSADDAAVNRSGRFSHAQRSQGRRKLLFASSRVVVSCASLYGLVELLNSGVSYPVFGALFGVIALLAFSATSVWSVVDALARLVAPKPLCVLARLDTDPTNRNNLVLESDGGRPMKITRAALAIAEAPFSVLRTWRFEVYLLPWTRSVVAVVPVPPSNRKRSKETAAPRAAERASSTSDAAPVEASGE